MITFSIIRIIMLIILGVPFFKKNAAGGLYIHVDNKVDNVRHHRMLITGNYLIY